jgi:large subunit ribosomal protein L22
VETKASSKYIRISARKARLVVDTIRGKDLAAAQQILDFSDRAAARVVGKVLRAAAANAENNNGLTPDNLFVSRAYVDEGPTLKRFRPRAMGRATRINKRTCHITVVLDERELEKVAPKRGRLRKAVTGRGKAATARGKAEEKEKAEAAEEQEKPEEKAEAATAKPKAAKAKKPAAKAPAKKAAAKKAPAAKAAKAAKPEAAKKEKPAEPKKKAEPASPKDKEKPPAKEKSED